MFEAMVTQKTPVSLVISKVVQLGGWGVQLAPVADQSMARRDMRLKSKPTPSVPARLKMMHFLPAARSSSAYYVR